MCFPCGYCPILVIVFERADCSWLRHTNLEKMFSRLTIVSSFILILGNIVLSQRFTKENSHSHHQQGGINTYKVNYMCDYCPPMWTQFQNSCYRYVGNATNSWQNAENKCKSFLTSAGQGHLVSILSEKKTNSSTNSGVRLWFVTYSLLMVCMIQMTPSWSVCMTATSKIILNGATAIQ